MGDLSEDFSKHEFECKCGCGICNVSPTLIKQLQRLRTLYHKPIIINSGCRCPAHNASEGGVSDSAHVTTLTEQGEAADIKITNGGEIYELLDLVYTYTLFSRIGIGTHLIHFDVDIQKPQHVIWVYPNK